MSIQRYRKTAKRNLTKQKGGAGTWRQKFFPKRTAKVTPNSSSTSTYDSVITASPANSNSLNPTSNQHKLPQRKGSNALPPLPHESINTKRSHVSKPTPDIQANLENPYEDESQFRAGAEKAAAAAGLSSSATAHIYENFDLEIQSYYKTLSDYDAQIENINESIQGNKKMIAEADRNIKKYADKLVFLDKARKERSASTAQISWYNSKIQETEKLKQITETNKERFTSINEKLLTALEQIKKSKLEHERTMKPNIIKTLEHTYANLPAAMEHPYVNLNAIREEPIYNTPSNVLVGRNQNNKKNAPIYGNLLPNSESESPYGNVLKQQLPRKPTQAITKTNSRPKPLPRPGTIPKTG
jgi:hypothetical protein